MEPGLTQRRGLSLFERGVCHLQVFLNQGILNPPICLAVPDHLDTDPLKEIIRLSEKLINDASYNTIPEIRIHLLLSIALRFDIALTHIFMALSLFKFLSTKGKLERLEF